MRVGVFTYGMDDKLTGIGRYAVELTRALRRLDPDLELTLLTPYPDSAHPWYREFETYPLPGLARLPAALSVGQRALGRAARALELDVLHDPCGVAPFLDRGGRYRRVTTVHDAVPYLYPETQPLLTRLVFQTLIRAARYTADAVLTDSHSAAADLERCAGIPRHKLVVTPLGVRRSPPRGVAEVQATRARLGVRPPYLLYVGALHPRKNLARVARAFATLRGEGVAAQLVIVGPPSWGAHETLRELQGRSRQDAAVVLTGFVTDDDLAGLYEGARALVFPSLYEGFGLPALEAMAHGTPVLASNTGALPEVVGDAGLLVDPESTEAIAQAMRALLGDDALARALGLRGLGRAADFSWERTAGATLALYRRLVYGPPLTPAEGWSAAARLPLEEEPV